jgi:hypothetical protein
MTWPAHCRPQVLDKTLEVNNVDPTGFGLLDPAELGIGASDLLLASAIYRAGIDDELSLQAFRARGVAPEQ